MTIRSLRGGQESQMFPGLCDLSELRVENGWLQFCRTMHCMG